jgi:uroporphyrinogen III methyltransferase / synthase
MGAEAIEFPTIETVPPDSYAALDAAIGKLDRFDWIVFTSATGVEAFIARLKHLNRDVREIGKASIAAIGPATAARLREFALNPAAMPKEYRAEAIVGAIGITKIRGASFLIPRAQVAREILPELLRKNGAREVEVAPAYKTTKPKNTQAERIREMIRAGQIDLVAFTSSSTVTNFCELIGEIPRGLKAAPIGPITAETARSHGFDVVVNPPQFTIPALTTGILDYFRQRS